MLQFRGGPLRVNRRYRSEDGTDTHCIFPVHDNLHIWPYLPQPGAKLCGTAGTGIPANWESTKTHKPRVTPEKRSSLQQSLTYSRLAHYRRVTHSALRTLKMRII